MCHHVVDNYYCLRHGGLRCASWRGAVGENQLVTAFAYQIASNEVKILGHRGKVDLVLIKKSDDELIFVRAVAVAACSQYIEPHNGSD